MKRISAQLALILFAVLWLHTGCQKETGRKEQLSAYTVQKNVVYGTALNYQRVQQSLGMDVYLPQNGRKDNPLLLLLHSGGFYTGNREELAEFCQYFAQRNFTTVTMSYRLGWQTGNLTNLCGGNAYSVMQAGYRAIQDAHAAMRYLVANAEKFNIDTAKIFMGGASAGAITALSTTFISQTEFNQFFGQLENELGGLTTSGNNLSNTYRIKGVLNMWGGLLSTSVINTSEITPVISFHGSGDPVVPYHKGRFAGCSEYPEFHGSKAVYEVLTEKGTPTVLHTQAGGGHGVYDLNYLAQNSYCFLKQVLAGEKPSGSFANTVSDCR